MGSVIRPGQLIGSEEVKAQTVCVHPEKSAFPQKTLTLGERLNQFYMDLSQNVQRSTFSRFKVTSFRD